MELFHASLCIDSVSHDISDSINLTQILKQLLVLRALDFRCI